MRGGRIMILGILAILVGGWIAWRVTQLRRVEAPRRGGAAPIVTQGTIGRAPRLADGSYNPIANAKIKPEDDIAARAAALAWRERYRPLLEKALPPTTTTLFYVYPCLDRTPDGVGLHFTYGWRLTVSAALTQWTDARLAGGREPRHSGLPELQDDRPLPPPTAAEWTRLALEDPAAAEARYLITGLYDYDPGRKTYSFRAWLIDRTAPDRPRDMALASQSAARGSFGELAAEQRDAARAAAQTLIDLGLARPRAGLAGDVALDDEIASVTRLLDLGDSWAVMDGIDRALALAELFPQQTLPLQAAAYGFMQLYWAYGAYATYVPTANLDALKAWALCQVALAMDPRPEMTRVTWAYACGAAGHAVQRRMDEAEKAGGGPLSERAAYPELNHYRNMALDNPLPVDGTLARETLPEWAALWLDMRQFRSGRQSALRDYFAARAARWAGRDLYLMALLHGYDAHYDLGDMGGADAKQIGSRAGCQGSLAGELAAMLTALGAGAEAQALAGKIPGLDEAGRGRLAALARAGDYYGARAALLGAFADWKEPASESHPVYGLLGEMEGRMRTMAEDPRYQRGLTRYAVFENTPAERVRRAAGRDHVGPFMLAEREGLERGDYATAVGIAQATLARRPTNGAAHYNMLLILEKFPRAKGAAELTTAAARLAYGLCPLEPAALSYLGQALWAAGRRQEGEACLKACERADPFNVFLNQRLGEFYYQVGQFGRAASYLEAFLKEMPERYDVAIERAWALCQIGKWNETGVREAFTKAIAAMPSDPRYHEENLNYLVNWAGDLAAAREAARAYRRSVPQSAEPRLWEAQVEKADGNTSRALELLGEASGAGLSGLALAAYHVRLAQAYLEYGRPGLAAPHVQAAAGIDPAQPWAIAARGDLALAQGDAAGALTEYQRVIERFGPDPAMLLKVAAALEKQGGKERAVELLEEKIFGDRQEDIGLCLRLLGLYAELNRPEKAGRLLEIVLNSPRRNRSALLAAADLFKTIDPAVADELRQRVDQLIAGPGR